MNKPYVIIAVLYAFFVTALTVYLVVHGHETTGLLAIVTALSPILLLALKQPTKGTEGDGKQPKPEDTDSEDN